MKHISWIRTTGIPVNDVPKFAKTISVRKGLRRAVARVSAIGVYRMMVDGAPVDDKIMTPGWVSKKRNLAVTHDLMPVLKPGKNEISLYVASGWKCGECNRMFDNRKIIPEDAHVSVCAEIVLSYENGVTETIVTDESWDVYSTPYLFAEIYQGETFDGTVEEKKRGKAVLDPSVHAKVVPFDGVPVKEQERICASRFFIAPNGDKLLDFGQETAGYIEIRYRGKAGDRIHLSFGEVLDKDGNFYNINYRDAKNDILYVLDGKREIYKPMFTFHGYRYVRIDEFPGEIDKDCFTSVAIYSDMERLGHFSCGYEKVNALYNNILYGQRSNFIDIPTDCPQRDERLGWTGDAQVFCRTACLNYNAKAFFTKWLRDMALEQHENGYIPAVIPDALINGFPAAAWSDAATVCPMEVYLAYGDKKLLKEHYPMMLKWVNCLKTLGSEPYLWVGDFHWGDWLAGDGDSEFRFGATQTDLIASAYFAYSVDLCIRAGRILGEDVSDLEVLHKNVRNAFRAAFMKDGLPTLYPHGQADFEKHPENKGHVHPITQTGICLILAFNLCEENEKKKLIDKLVELIRKNDGRMSTGFVGTPLILSCLTDNGYAEAAYDLLLQEKNPSWLFSVDHGATTIWEHWDSVNENGDFWSDDMNSFNHYAYGAVYAWLFGRAAGITVDDEGAGYSHVHIRPYPDRRLGHLRVGEKTPYGELFVSWRYHMGTVRYEIEIPADMTATMSLPGQKTKELSGGKYLFVLPENE